VALPLAAPLLPGVAPLVTPLLLMGPLAPVTPRLVLLVGAGGPLAGPSPLPPTGASRSRPPSALSLAHRGVAAAAAPWQPGPWVNGAAAHYTVAADRAPAMRMGVLCVICVVVTSSLECVAVERVCQAHVCSHGRLLWVDSGAVPGCWT
jgi:hypothetical protein